MALCLLVRVASNYYFPDQIIRNFTMTHLRIDSLLAGVLISYMYYFRFNLLVEKFNKYKIFLGIISVLCLAWMPFFSLDSNSFFINTIGLSLLYISFSIILLFFLLTKNINKTLNSLFSKYAVNAVSKIGFCSYSIYIIHWVIITTLKKFELTHHLYYRIGHNLFDNKVFNFILAVGLSIAAGMAMTYFVENYFLKIRDRFYPSRSTIQKKYIPIQIQDNAKEEKTIPI